MDIWHPERFASPHRMTPQRCPDAVAVTVQPAASASRSASSTSFLGCLALATLTRYNDQPHVIHLDDLGQNDSDSGKRPAKGVIDVRWGMTLGKSLGP